MSYLDELGSNLKNYCYIGNQRPRICLIAKFGSKTKILKGCVRYIFASLFFRSKREH